MANESGCLNGMDSLNSERKFPIGHTFSLQHCGSMKEFVLSKRINTAGRILLPWSVTGKGIVKEGYEQAAVSANRWRILFLYLLANGTESPLDNSMCVVNTC
jgi:hypothetical protein